MNLPTIPYLHEPNLGRKRVLARRLALQYERLACGQMSKEIMGAASRTTSDIDFNGRRDDNTSAYLIQVGGKDLVNFLSEAISRGTFGLADKAFYYDWLSQSNKIRFVRLSHLRKENRFMTNLVGKAYSHHMNDL